jgi:hypothetical protein
MQAEGWESPVTREGGETTGQQSWEGAGPSLVGLEEDAGDPPPGWPSVADYWPDAPHRIGPQADVYHLDENAAPVVVDRAAPDGPAPLRDRPPMSVLRRPPAAASDAAVPGSTEAVTDSAAATSTEVAPEKMVTEELTPDRAPSGAAGDLGTSPPRGYGVPARAPEDEPRDPFENLILAEDFQHRPVTHDDLHWDGETSTVPRTRRGGRVLATVALALLLLVGLTALIVVQLPGGADDQPTAAVPAVPEATPKQTDPPAADDPAEPPADRGLSASAPLDGRSEATFALLTDATVLSVRTTALDDDLFRVSTPEKSGVRPNAVTSAAEVRLFLEPSENEDATAVVEVLLSDQVRWSVRLLAGVDEGAVDLSAADVAEVTLAGGATSIDLSLPSPSGTLPITLTKGANQLTVHTPDRVPTRAAIRQGAGKVQIDGASRNGIAKGEVFQSRDWQDATDRLDLDASAGLGTLTIESA